MKLRTLLLSALLFTSLAYADTPVTRNPGRVPDSGLTISYPNNGSGYVTKNLLTAYESITGFIQGKITVGHTPAATDFFGYTFYGLDDISGLVSPDSSFALAAISGYGNFMSVGDIYSGYGLAIADNVGNQFLNTVSIGIPAPITTNADIAYLYVRYNALDTNGQPVTNAFQVTDASGVSMFNVDPSGNLKLTGIIQGASGVNAYDPTNGSFYSPTNGTQAFAFDVTANSYFYGNVNMQAHSFVLDTSTGTKFGTATNQKLSFYNSTPIVQPTGDILTALTNLGLVATPTLSAGDISSGTLAVAQGGTNIGSYAVGDLIYASGSTTLSKLADVATGSVLVSGGVTTAPTYSATPTITTSVTCPKIIGGTATNSTLTLQSTSGVGASGADIIFKTGNAGATETARTHWDGTFALFGVGKTPTAFCDITGAAPVSVAGTGTTATNTFNVLGATGGATSGSTGQAGGIGALFNITAGTGGGIPSSISNAASAGAGGAGTVAAGTGGTVNGSGATGTGGNGGQMNVNSGAGGGSNMSSSSVVGGNGGLLSLVAGTGGTGTASGAVTATGGNGGGANLTAGNGGNSSTATTLVGGNGGAVTITAGNGGQGATTNGNAGSLTLSGGTSGSGAGTAGTGSSITFKTAASTALATAGTINTDQTWSFNKTFKNYNNIATVSNGVSSELATIDTTALTANVTASTLYSVPAAGAGLYRVSAYTVETTAGSLSSTLPNIQLVYTDNDSNTSVTIDATPILGVAGIGQTGALTANTVGTASSGVIVIYVKASTTVQYQTVNYASNLAGMAYAIHIKLEAL